MQKLPEWDRPKLTETQLNGEEKRLAPRGLFPNQVRADLICALASMPGATSISAACHALSIEMGADAGIIENCLNGVQPIYAAILDALYGPGLASVLPSAWDSPAQFGPLLSHAIAAGLAETCGYADAPDPTTSPDSGAAGLPPTVDPSAPDIAALAPTPSASGDTEPAGPETTLSAPELGPVASVEAEAPPVLSPVSLRAPDAAGEGEARDTPPTRPVLLREVPAAAGHPSPAQPLMFTAAVPQPVDPLGLALDELARQIQRLQAEQREAEARARLAHNGRQALMKAYDQLVDAQTALRLVDDGERAAA